MEEDHGDRGQLLMPPGTPPAAAGLVFEGAASNVSGRSA